MKKFFAIALALLMLVAVFAVPTSAKAEGAQAPYDAYEMLLGKEWMRSRFDEPLDWSEREDKIPARVILMNAGSTCRYANVRIQTIFVPEDQTFTEGTKIAINWQITAGGEPFIALNYDLGTGILSGADMNKYLTQVDYSAAIPENGRTGYIQFITFLSPDENGIFIEKTFANGVLIYQRRTTGSTDLGEKAFRFWNANNDTTSYATYSPAYENQGVKTISMTMWVNNKATTDSLAAGLYNAFARYYDKDVVWYPQDVTKNGFVIGNGGVRYYKDGVMQTGWVGTRYFLKETGYMVTEAREIGGVPYAPKRTKTNYDGETRYFYTGKLAAVDGAYRDFYFRNGEKVKGWLDDTHYYYLETGIKCTTSRTIGGVYYEYDTVNDKLSKQQGLIDEDGDVFYLIDGVKAGGWQNIDGEWYYFYKETGVMIIGATVKILGVEHTFDENGACKDYNPQ